MSYEQDYSFHITDFIFITIFIFICKPSHVGLKVKNVFHLVETLVRKEIIYFFLYLFRLKYIAFFKKLTSLCDTCLSLVCLPLCQLLVTKKIKLENQILTKLILNQAIHF